MRKTNLFIISLSILAICFIIFLYIKINIGSAQSSCSSLFVTCNSTCTETYFYAKASCNGNSYFPSCECDGLEKNEMRKISANKKQLENLDRFKTYIVSHFTDNRQEIETIFSEIQTAVTTGNYNHYQMAIHNFFEITEAFSDENKNIMETWIKENTLQD